MKTLKGKKLSGGCVIGRAYCFCENRTVPQRVTLDPSRLERETERIAEAMKRTAAAMLETAESNGGEAAAIMEAHAEIASDEFLMENAVELVRVGQVNSEFAVWRVYEDSALELEGVNDDYCAARANDLRDVCMHIIAALQGKDQNISFPEGSIVVAEDISPSAAAVLETCGVTGLICEHASQTSHAAIMARASGIPCVTDIADIFGIFEGGELVCLDADEGHIVLDPDEDTLKIFEKKIKKQREKAAEARRTAKERVFFKDGRHFEILLNISSPKDCADEALEISDGIGLYRTEYLYMHSLSIPDFEAQRKEYEDLLRRTKGRAVTVRTLDIGADKQCPSIKSEHEDNPALGLRGIRLCFERNDIFIEQLKALLAASPLGDLGIMFPMIAEVGDILRAREYLERAKNELDAEGIVYDENIRIGVMLELPSALIMADKIAQLVDFASIGTNDLCQYTMAADRMNSRVGDYADPFSPAVLRLIFNAANEFGKRGKQLCVCGEAASNPASALLLAGLGVTSLSMSAPAVPYVKTALKNNDHDDLCRVAHECLAMVDAHEIRSLAEREFKL